MSAGGGTDRKPVVCDSGTGFVKCGFAGDVCPRGVFPSLVRRSTPDAPGEVGFSGRQDAAFGYPKKNQRCAVSYPIRDGIIQDWDDMHLVWDHAINDILRIDARQSKILLTDPPLNPTSNRQRMLETMFEHYGFEGAFVQIQAVLTLYAQGLLTGLVVDAGDGVTHMVPVVDGFSFPHLTKRLDVAGRHISERLLELLQRRGGALGRSIDLESARRLKERTCYVAADFAREQQLARETTAVMQSYMLPDGRVIRVGAERFTAPEALFNPSLLGREGPGASELVFNCIQGMDLDNRMGMYSHIVLSGGTTMFPGLASRLERDIKRLYLDRTLQGERAGMRRLKLRIEDPPHRKHLVFQGGAILAEIMAEREDFWVSRKEWGEDPHRALKKCGSL